MKSFSSLNVIKPHTIVFIGTSITLDRPADFVFLDDTWAYQIGVARGYSNYINAGAPSDTTTLMLARWESAVCRHYPGSVSIEVGPNDEFFDVPIATSESNLRSMISKSQRMGTRVTLMVPILVRDDYANSNVEAWRTLTRNLAIELGCELFDVYPEQAVMTEGELDALYLVSDNYHINVVGHTYITNFALSNNVLELPVTSLSWR